MKGKSSSVVVDSDGYIYADGVKIARYIPEKGCLQFYDKDRLRSTKRGTNLVEVPLADVAALGEKAKY